MRDVPALLSIKKEKKDRLKDEEEEGDGYGDENMKCILREYRNAHLQNEKDKVLGVCTTENPVSKDCFKPVTDPKHEYDIGTEVSILISRDSSSIKDFVTPVPFRNTNLQRDEQKMTLSQCLNRFSRPERLDAENKWYCSKCKDHLRATKRLEFWNLPDVFIVHLKRFKYRGGMGMFMGGGSDKISSYVDFPTQDLDMTPYVLSKNGNHVYDLYAVTNHYGRSGYGHYTAFARDISDMGSVRKLGPWYVFDDEQCKNMGFDDENVKSSAAYLLFYLRRPSGIVDLVQGMKGDDDDEEEEV